MKQGSDDGGVPRVLMLSAELAPFAKTGGLADVVPALSKTLRGLGVDVRVALPCYGFIDASGSNRTKAVDNVAVPIGRAVRSAAITVTEEAGVPVYLVRDSHYFGSRDRLYGYEDDGERFIFFCRGALEGTRALGWRPDVVHCHDWHCGLVPNWLRTTLRGDPHFASMAAVFTIHNLAYQGHFGRSVLEAAGLDADGFIPHPTHSHLSKVLNFMSRGIRFADVVSTVSTSYAEEILGPEHGEHLDPVLRERREHLFGIVNGIDTDIWNPAEDPHLAARYDVNRLAARAKNKRALQERLGLPVRSDALLIGMVSRLAEHKGFDLIEPLLARIPDLDAQLVVLGVGDPRYQDMLRQAAGEYPSCIRSQRAFDDGLAHLIYGGSDALLMPSRFEPCGLGQLIAMRYGSVPIVRATGGLADTVPDARDSEGTGFTFSRYDPIDLFGALARARESFRHSRAWQAIMRRGMARDASWNAPAERYLALYERARVGKRAMQPTGAAPD